MDFLGFYLTCSDHEHIDQKDDSLQRQAKLHSEAPVLLKFNAGEPVVSDKVIYCIKCQFIGRRIITTNICLG